MFRKIATSAAMALTLTGVLTGMAGPAEAASGNAANPAVQSRSLAPVYGSATPVALARDGNASFDGRTIDLSRSWDAAKVCVVSNHLTRAACFGTESEAATFRTAGATTLTRTSNSALACTSPLLLWADGGHAGRQLQFCDTGYWQNLSTYSFDNQMSAYQTGASSAHLADGSGGGGYWYPGNTNSYHYEPVLLNGWNDRVSSIYLY